LEFCANIVQVAEPRCDAGGKPAETFGMGAEAVPT
jgi:hypothetical protein